MICCWGCCGAGAFGGLALAALVGAGFKLAGCAGGAIFTDGRAAATVAACSRVCCTGNGRPGCFANCCCCLTNGTGGGGGGVFATTVRLATAAGGRAIWAAAGLGVPSTLSLTGTTAALGATGAAAIRFSSTGTTALATGAELRKTVAGTAVTAPGTVWFA